MKPVFNVSKFAILLLIIYTLFFSDAFGQHLELKILGENDLETLVVDSLGYLRSHPDYLSITSEVDSIQKTLFRIGFIENKLVAIHKINDSTFNAKIHLRKKYNTIYIYYDHMLVEKEILNQVSDDVTDSYFKISINETENALSIINSKISEQGFPFSTLKLSEIKAKDESNLQTELIVTASPNKRTVDHIIIKGYESFSKSYLKHYLKIRPSETFNINTIKKKTQRLKNLRFAKEIKPPEILFTRDSTSLYLYVEKSKSNSFDGFLGFGTNEDTNKLQFDGYLNLNLINNLNYGESFNLIYKSDENDQKTFRTKLILPYFFGTPLGAEVELNIFKRDSSFTTIDQKAKVFYQFNSKSKAYAGIAATQSNNLLSENPTSLIEDYDTTFYTMAYEFINLQVENLLFPVNSSLFIEAGIGKRKLTNSSLNQNSVFIDLFKIFNLNQKNSLYARLNGSGLFSDSYFENELLRFGGINSIRGFEENNLLASLYGVLNTEYRYQIDRGIYVHSIIDLAYFENDITLQKEKLFGFGFGFGILTNAGLLKFNYANGKQENQQFKLSNSKIHLSLVANF